MEKVKITIDEHVLMIEEGRTIMQAAEQANIYIPHLCHHPDLPDLGECGLCIVEIDGESEVQKACMTKAVDGMVIHTKTEKLASMRRLNMELMLSNHVDDCTTCPKYSNCELQSLYQYLGVTVGRLRQTQDKVPVNDKNPLIVRDLNRCVSCGRCVRVCHDVRGVGALDFERTESGRVQVDVKGHKLLADVDCRFCGACVEVCPTGALQDKEGLFRTDISRDKALIPCQAECPAHVNIPEYIRAIHEGDYQEAIAVIRESVPFPGALGHVCMAFCEKNCRHNGINDSLSIRELKKFAASQDKKLWRDKVTVKPDTGKKVAIVGAGPAGLTAAYDLRKCGHDVTVFEKMPAAGGMMSMGIPDYRLPRDLVQSEVDEITRIGVKLLVNTEVKSVKELQEQGFDAVVFAMGTGNGVRLPIPGKDADDVYVNIDFLRHASLGNPLPVGEKVVVLGGGNVAFDCARVAKRLGAKQISMACLEARNAMTASDDEIEEGLAEGIVLYNSRTFVSIETENGKVTGVKCQKIASFGFDENKALKLEIEPDSDEIIPADTVIFATGQRVEITEAFGLPLGRGNSIQTVDGTRVSTNALYAAGDAVYGTKSVIQAIASGHQAARAVDVDLGGNGDFEDVLAAHKKPDGYIGKVESFASLCKTKECGQEGQACKESGRCLQCDLRTQIERPRLWNSY